MNFKKLLISDSNDPFWLSAKYVNSSGGSGTFRWEQVGLNVDNSLWGPNEPDQFGPGKQACAYFDSRGDKLFDEDCSKSLYILCDIPVEIEWCMSPYVAY